MLEKIRSLIQESIKIKEDLINTSLNDIKIISGEIIATLRNGGKVILFGNGGSASDAQHIAAELIGRFKKDRRALPAIALSSNTSILTCLGNDYGFEKIFSRQIEAIGRSEDIAIGISTSGKSKNVILAIKEAKKLGMKTISFTGSNGGELANLTDFKIIIPSKETPRIQEAHITIAHIICELVEDAFVYEK